MKPVKPGKPGNIDCSQSPFKPGECKCGIPNCPGHPIINDKIIVSGHPLQQAARKEDGIVKVNSKGAAKPDSPVFKRGYTVNMWGGKPAPDASVAECKCGVPNCQGHQPDADGMIHITNHPSGKHFVLNMRKRIAN
jgi:hypothetical protein